MAMAAWGQDTGTEARRGLEPIHRTIPLGDGAAAAASEALATLTGAVGDSVYAHAQLLLSELISQRAANYPSDRKDAMGLEISLNDDCLRIQLTDYSRAPPIQNPGSAAHGWTLELVSEIAERWGLHRGEVTTLWLELSR